MANEKITDAELRHLCDEIAKRDGVVRINVLREAAGGGSYARLARVIDDWGRERGSAKPRPLRLRKGLKARAVREREDTGLEDAAQDAAPGDKGLGAAAALLREENQMLWRMLREEREARLAEIDRLNRLMDLMSRHGQASGV